MDVQREVAALKLYDLYQEWLRQGKPRRDDKKEVRDVTRVSRDSHGA